MQREEKQRGKQGGQTGSQKDKRRQFVTADIPFIPPRQKMKEEAATDASKKDSDARWVSMCIPSKQER